MLVADLIAILEDADVDAEVCVGYLGLDGNPIREEATKAYSCHNITHGSRFVLATNDHHIKEYNAIT